MKQFNVITKQNYKTASNSILLNSKLELLMQTNLVQGIKIKY
jgi:hypothetical protein